MDEAERITREKIAAGNETPALRVELAAAAAMQKQPDVAVKWLGEAVEQGYRDYDFIQRDPIFRTALGNDARLTGLIDSMRRDVAVQRARARDRGLLAVDELLVRDK